MFDGPKPVHLLGLKQQKKASDKLKDELQGSERTRRMQVYNLRREFEAIKMKEFETVNEFP